MTGAPGPVADDDLAGPLKRYRAIAWVVGVGLLVLVVVGIPLKYAAGAPAVVQVVGPLHGALYVVYLLLTADLAVRARWHPLWALLVAAAGTVPFLSFVAERAVARRGGRLPRPGARTAGAPPSRV